MKLLRNEKGPQPLVVPRLSVIVAAGETVEIAEDLREVGQNLIDQGYFTEVTEPVAPASKPKPKESVSGEAPKV